MTNALSEEAQKKLVDVTNEASMLVEKHSVDQESLMLTACALYSVTKQCLEVALGQEAAAAFLSTSIKDMAAQNKMFH